MFKDSQLQTRQKADGAHLTLVGEFNASLATQLLHYIRTYYDLASSIYIHTEGVTEFEPLGLIIFRYNIEPMNYEFSRFVLTGKNVSFFINVWPSDCLPHCVEVPQQETLSYYF